MLVASLLSTGCFGYNRSAKRIAYVGDATLMVAGGGALAAELLLKEEEDCQGAGCVESLSPVTGPLVLGTMLVTAGLVGIIFNATRPIVKTSR